MQDEQFDNMDELIRAAAQSHHPAYDEGAWIKMAALLDKQLPEKKDRRRPAVLFVVGILITMVVFFAVLYPWNKNTNPAGNTTSGKMVNGSIQSMPAKDQSVNIGPTQNLPVGKGPESQDFTQHNGKDGIEETIKKAIPKNRFTSSKNYVTINGSPVGDGIGDDKEGALIKDKVQPEIAKQSAGEDNSSMTDSFSEKLKQPSIIQTDPIDETARTALTNNSTETINSKKSPGKLPAEKNFESGFQNNFAITLSAGSDLSFVRLEAAGKARLYYGAGLSYTFAKRITLSSGLYVSNKTYSAAPADYHPPKGYWTYTTKLERVDADCKVYEIPLSAGYNFKQSKNHGWMAGIGLSTFLMKSETYHYLYKNSQGLTMYKGWTLRNKNNHYFSVMTISGGYQYRVNPCFSIIAAPYLKLPLHGIGFGKIKLNSGGLLITAAIQPFAKRK